jgi:hypothetical protein
MFRGQDAQYRPGREVQDRVAGDHTRRGFRGGPLDDRAPQERGGTEPRPLPQVVEEKEDRKYDSRQESGDEPVSQCTWRRGHWVPPVSGLRLVQRENQKQQRQVDDGVLEDAAGVPVRLSPEPDGEPKETESERERRPQVEDAGQP